MGFWNSFNNWYRTFWEESGRRPGVQEVKRWYEDCADACWGPSKPSWEETRTHSKCLRSLEQVRSYFKAYRAAKKEGVEGSCRSEATRSCGAYSQQPSLRARSMSAISAQDDDPPFVMRAPKARRPSDSETADGSFFSFATATGACYPTASETTTTTTTNSPGSKYSSRTQELGGAGGRAVRSSSFTGHSMSLASGLGGGAHARTVSTGGGSSGSGMGTGVRAAVRMVFGEDAEGRALPILLQRAPGESLPIPVSANNAAAWMLPPPAPPPSRMPSPTPTSAPDGCSLGAGKALPPLPPLPSLQPLGGTGACSTGPSFPGAASAPPVPHQLSPYFYSQPPAAVGAGLISPVGQLEPHTSWPPSHPSSSDRPPLPPTHSGYPHYPGLHNSPYYPPSSAGAVNTATSSVPGSVASGTGLRPCTSAPTMLPTIPFPSSQSLPPLPRIADVQAAQKRGADSAAAAAAAAAAVAAVLDASAANPQLQQQAQPSSHAPGAASAEGSQGSASIPPMVSSSAAPGSSQPGQQQPGAYPYPYPMDPYGAYPGYYDPYYSYPYWGYPPPYGYPGPMSRYPSPTGPAGAAGAGNQQEKDDAACASGPASAPPAPGMPGHPYSHYGRYPMMLPAYGPHGRPPTGPGLVSPVNPAPSGIPLLPPSPAGAAAGQCCKVSTAASCGAPKPPVGRAPGRGKLLPAHAQSAAAMATINPSQPHAQAPLPKQQQQLPAPSAEDFATMVESFFLDGGDVDVADLDLQLDAADEAVIYGHVQQGAAAGEAVTGAGAVEQPAAVGTGATPAAPGSSQPRDVVQQIKVEPHIEIAAPPFAPHTEPGSNVAKPLVKPETETVPHSGEAFAHGPGSEDVDATVTLRVPLPSSAKSNGMADSPFPFSCLESTGLTPLVGKAMPHVRAPLPGGKTAASAQLQMAGMELQPNSASALAAVMAMDEGTPLADLRSLAAELPSRGTSLQGFEMLDIPDLGGAGSLCDEMRELDCQFFLTSPAMGARHTVC
ncbi:hypothetical protein HYH02_005092 [Chlamydomonas schloesseri]|uniref:Uncharacterized protein n=1 Tax=Chlamydomonas schloesseri TaxID=2026947 RepID=A0A836B7J1_9CHLO|nr:hypothetical protein HYH02_005092 [Chlamydomonas schloesseri]|eukprot:KAG2449559.1 hypothetical protein HYH02_005092 [Chlamydomonas schloesseri]